MKYLLPAYAVAVTLGFIAMTFQWYSQRDTAEFWHNETDVADAKNGLCNSKMYNLEDHYYEKVVEEQEEEKICEFEENSQSLALKRLTKRINSDSLIISNLQRCYLYGMDIDKCVGVDLKDYVEENESGSFR